MNDRIIHVRTESGAFLEIVVHKPVFLDRAEDLTTEERLAAVQQYILNRYGKADIFETQSFVDPGEGMIIGSVDPLHITDDTPMDPDQWDEGQPWHTKPSP